MVVGFKRDVEFYPHPAQNAQKDLDTLMTTTELSREKWNEGIYENENDSSSGHNECQQKTLQSIQHISI